MKQGERKEKKDAKNKKSGENRDAEAEDAQPENGGIHPARLAMMQGPQRQQYPNHRQRY